MPERPTDVVAFRSPWTSHFTVDRRFPHHLVNSEGEYLYILNKTEWHYFTCRSPEHRLRRAWQQGISVIRVGFECNLFWEDLSYDGWPWGGTRVRPDWSSFNEPYLEQVEDRIRMAGEEGIGIDFVIYTSLEPRGDEVARHLPMWERVLSRYARFTNVVLWEIHNEYITNEDFQDAAGTFFAANDPFRRPVATSDGTTDDATWCHKAWVSVAVNHSCTSSTARHPLAAWYRAVAWNTRSHGLPAFCNESGREVRHGNDDPHHRRKQSWIWAAAGCFWTYHSREGCEGIDDLDYRGPGSEYLSPLRDVVATIEFWRLEPCHTLISGVPPGLVVSAAATIARDLSLIYICTEETGRRVDEQNIDLRLPDGTYSARVVTPSSGETGSVERLCSAGLSFPTRLQIPAFTDDIVFVIEVVVTAERTLMEGTT